MEGFETGSRCRKSACNFGRRTASVERATLGADECWLFDVQRFAARAAPASVAPRFCQLCRWAEGGDRHRLSEDAEAVGTL